MLRSSQGRLAIVRKRLIRPRRNISCRGFASAHFTYPVVGTNKRRPASLVGSLFTHRPYERVSAVWLSSSSQERGDENGYNDDDFVVEEEYVGIKDTKQSSGSNSVPFSNLWPQQKPLWEATSQSTTASLDDKASDAGSSIQTQATDNSPDNDSPVPISSPTPSLSELETLLSNTVQNLLQVFDERNESTIRERWQADLRFTQRLDRRDNGTPRQWSYGTDDIALSETSTRFPSSSDQANEKYQIVDEKMGSSADLTTRKLPHDASFTHSHSTGNTNNPSSTKVTARDKNMLMLVDNLLKKARASQPDAPAACPQESQAEAGADPLVNDKRTETDSTHPDSNVNLFSSTIGDEIASNDALEMSPPIPPLSLEEDPSTSVADGPLETPVNGRQVSETATDWPNQFDAPMSTESSNDPHPDIEAIVLLRSMRPKNWRAFDEINAKPDPECSEVGVVAEEPVATSQSTTIEKPSSFFNIMTTAIDQEKDKLSTADCNSILAGLAIAPHDGANKRVHELMQTYHHMLSNGSQPDATTYEILIRVLNNRFGSFQTAARLVRSIMEDDKIEWTPMLLVATGNLCQRGVLVGLGYDLLKDVSNRTTECEIPHRFVRYMVKLSKANYDSDTALALLKNALRAQRGATDRGLDLVFKEAITWPAVNSYGKIVDNGEVLSDILEILETSSHYRASVSVWRALIFGFAKLTGQDYSRWEFVERTFDGLSRVNPNYVPDDGLVNIGLQLGEVRGASQLAADLICRALGASATTPFGEDPAGVTFSDIRNGMNVCVKARDAHSCRKILNKAKQSDLPKELLRSLYLLCLKACASVGETEMAERLILEMHDKDLNPSEPFQGALMYAYALGDQFENAQTLMDSMEGGESNFQPGPSCYDGYILACVRNKAWDAVATAHESIKAANLLPPSPAASHGILLSAYNRGGVSEARATLKELRACGGILDRETSVLALKLLVPKIGSTTPESIQRKLRELNRNDKMVDLLRALSVAEIEDKRLPSQGLTERDITSRRQTAWNRVMDNLCLYMDQAETEWQ